MPAYKFQSNPLSRLLILFVALVVMGVFFWSHAKAVERQGLMLELTSERDGMIRVTVKNFGPHPALVDRRLAYGAPPAPVELFFQITDEKGRQLRFLDHINIRTADQRDWVLLRPGELVGRDISISKLAEAYGLRAKTYAIQAEYDARPEEKPTIRLRSNVLRFNSDTDALKGYCESQPDSLLRRNMPDLAIFCAH